MLLSEETSFIQGVHQTPIVGQQERTDDLNKRMRSRQFPDFPLEPQYDFRPVSTKISPVSYHTKSQNKYERHLFGTQCGDEFQSGNSQRTVENLCKQY